MASMNPISPSRSPSATAIPPGGSFPSPTPRSPPTRKPSTSSPNCAAATSTAFCWSPAPTTRRAPPVPIVRSPPSLAEASRSDPAPRHDAAPSTPFCWSPAPTARRAPPVPIVRSPPSLAEASRSAPSPRPPSSFSPIPGGASVRAANSSSANGPRLSPPSSASDHLALWGGQSWPQPPFRRLSSAESQSIRFLARSTGEPVVPIGRKSRKLQETRHFADTFEQGPVMPLPLLLLDLQMVCTLASALIAGRLYRSGLFRRYPALFSYMVFHALYGIFPLVLKSNSPAYFWFWCVAFPFVWALNIPMVRELCRIVLERHQGLYTLGRWVMYTGVA